MKVFVLACLALLLLITGVVWWSSGASAPGPVIASDQERVDVQTCAECHPGMVDQFATAPHSRTLRRGNDPEVLAQFAERSVEIRGRQFRFEWLDDQLWFSADDVPFAVRVDWVFGSGHHAMTPVSVDSDLQGRPRLTQLHVSCLGDGSLARTLGSDQIEADPPTLGILHNANETQRCFGCHTSSLPERDGRMDLQHAVANLDCSRCHPGAAAHAASEGERPLAVDWDQLSPLAAINRCGECHRRVDEFTPDELTPEHRHLVRFAPVGLSLSPCFRVSNDPEQGAELPRFDCLSCHDPHLPTRTDPEFFNARCRECHTEASEMAPHPRRLAGPCASQPADSSCIECHMPKVETLPGLSFTDHWIRVRD